MTSFEIEKVMGSKYMTMCFRRYLEELVALQFFRELSAKVLSWMQRCMSWLGDLVQR